MAGTFFMSYEFKASASGFFGTLSGQRLYSVEYYEQVEKLINDCMKVLKTGHDGATVTFEHFDNSVTELARIVTSGDKIQLISWQRNIYGYVSSTDSEEKELSKKEVKKFVLRAIELFREKDAAA